MIPELLTVLVLVHIFFTWVLAIRRGLAARRRDAVVKPDDPCQPPVSILVPAWNEHDTIKRCIKSLQQIDYPDWEAVILAGGPDGTYESARQGAAGDSRFRVLERGPDPKNAALTQGVQAARYDVLAFLDADCIVSAGWLRELIKPIAQGAAVSLGERFPERTTWITLAELMQNIRAYQILGSTMTQGDRSFAIRRDAFDRIGGLPVHTYAREDWDLGIRLHTAGEQVAFAPKAKLRTDRPATLREFWQNEVRWRRTHLSGVWEHRNFFLKHPGAALGQLFVYGLSVALALAGVVATMLAVFMPQARPTLVRAAALIFLWIAGRRAAIGGEVAAYTNDRVWLARSWTPVVLVFVSFMASIAALLTVRRGTPFDYKGPRQMVAAEVDNSSS